MNHLKNLFTGFVLLNSLKFYTYDWSHFCCLLFLKLSEIKCLTWNICRSIIYLGRLEEILKFEFFFNGICILSWKEEKKKTLCIIRKRKTEKCERDMHVILMRATFMLYLCNPLVIVFGENWKIPSNLAQTPVNGNSPPIPDITPVENRKQFPHAAFIRISKITAQIYSNQAWSEKLQNVLQLLHCQR